MNDDDNKYRIQLSVRGGETINADVFIHEDIESASECTLTIVSSRGTYTATASDYFDAFCAIRRELEVQGILPLCYGASRNVYPSGMCRDMGRGLTGYKMKRLAREIRSISLPLAPMSIRPRCRNNGHSSSNGGTVSPRRRGLARNPSVSRGGGSGDCLGGELLTVPTLARSNVSCASAMTAISRVPNEERCWWERARRSFR